MVEQGLDIWGTWWWGKACSPEYAFYSNDNNVDKTKPNYDEHCHHFYCLSDCTVEHFS